MSVPVPSLTLIVFSCENTRIAIACGHESYTANSASRIPPHPTPHRRIPTHDANLLPLKPARRPTQTSPNCHRIVSPRPLESPRKQLTTQDVVEPVKPHFHKLNSNKRSLYRFCIEQGLLRPEQIAQTTFYRFIREHKLLAEHVSDDDKQRLAFSMKYANQLWQADTMFGPYCDTGKSPESKKQTKLIAFLDDASRILCHGEFFFDENVDTLIKTIRSAFYKRGIPEQLLVDNGSIYCSQEITLICARVGCLLRHTAIIRNDDAAPFHK